MDAPSIQPHPYFVQSIPMPKPMEVDVFRVHSMEQREVCKVSMVGMGVLADRQIPIGANHGRHVKHVQLGLFRRLQVLFLR